MGTWPKCFDYLAQGIEHLAHETEHLQCRATDSPESGKFFFANRDTGQPGRVAGSVGLGSKQPGPDTLPAIPVDLRPPELAPLHHPSPLG